MKTCAACTAAVLSHAVPSQRRCPMGCESVTAIRVFIHVSEQQGMILALFFFCYATTLKLLSSTSHPDPICRLLACGLGVREN